MAPLVTLKVDAGETFTKPFWWEQPDGSPVDISDYEARMQIRRHVADAEVLLDLTTANSRLTVDGPAGRVDIVISAADTMALSDKIRLGTFDLELFRTVGGVEEVVRLAQGKVRVSANVTRPT